MSHRYLRVPSRPFVGVVARCWQNLSPPPAAGADRKPARIEPNPDVANYGENPTKRGRRGDAGAVQVKSVVCALLKRGKASVIHSSQSF